MNAVIRLPPDLLRTRTEIIHIRNSAMGQKVAIPALDRVRDPLLMEKPHREATVMTDRAQMVIAVFGLDGHEEDLPHIEMDLVRDGNVLAKLIYHPGRDGYRLRGWRRDPVAKTFVAGLKRRAKLSFPEIEEGMGREAGRRAVADIFAFMAGTVT